MHVKAGIRRAHEFLAGRECFRISGTVLQQVGDSPSVTTATIIAMRCRTIIARNLAPALPAAAPETIDRTCKPAGVGHWALLAS